MTYHFSKTVDGGFNETIERVTETLKTKGFGVLTRIDVDKTLQQKIGAEYHPYTILGACNPHFAYKALQAENKIGTMLPCNVVVQWNGNGQTEVSAVDPMASMQAIDNPALGEIAGEVRSMLEAAIAEV